MSAAHITPILVNGRERATELRDANMGDKRQTLNTTLIYSLFSYIRGHI